MAEAPPSRTKSRSPLARKVFLVVAGVLPLLLAGGSAFSIATIIYADSKLQRICTGSHCGGQQDSIPHIQTTPGECTKTPCNFLILGSDTRAGLGKKQQSQFGTPKSVQGQRADTIIVVNVDPIHDRTVVLSIPRDLRVSIPGHGLDKINSAFQYKHGADLMVRTVEKLTGLQINHYVEVNFAGFERLVTALGGVHLCVDQPMEDRLAGLHLPHAGCYTLKGAEALAFVRARHIQGDVIPDFSRISRQQQFMRVVIQKMLSIGVVFDYAKLVNAIKDNLIVDDHLNLYNLQDLTRKLSGLGQQGVLFRILPSAPVQVGGVDYLQMASEAKILFREIRDGTHLSDIGVEAQFTNISPANITVRVWDAGSGGRAERVATFLTDAGFVVLPVQPAPGGVTRTELVYRPHTSNEMAVVSNYLKVFATVNDFDLAKQATAEVVVVVGPDYHGLS